MSHHSSRCNSKCVRTFPVCSNCSSDVIICRKLSLGLLRNRDAVERDIATLTDCVKTAVAKGELAAQEEPMPPQHFDDTEGPNEKWR